MDFYKICSRKRGYLELLNLNVTNQGVILTELIICCMNVDTNKYVSQEYEQRMSSAGQQVDQMASELDSMSNKTEVYIKVRFSTLGTSTFNTTLVSRRLKVPRSHA